MKMTTRQLLGRKLVFGFSGTTLSGKCKYLLRECETDNRILFQPNEKGKVVGLCPVRV